MSFLFEKSQVRFDIDNLLVESMEGDGMGSSKLFPNGEVPEYKWGCNAPEFWFNDSDNIPVSAALYLNVECIPLEVDIWKVDLSPLKKWPKQEELSCLIQADNK